MSDIKRLIQQLAKNTDQRLYSTLAVVREIDRTNGSVTVEPIINDFDIDNPKQENFIYNVRVIPNVEQNQTINIPKLNTQVIINYLNDYDAYISSNGTTQAVTIRGGSNKIVVAQNDDGEDDTDIQGEFIFIESTSTGNIIMEQGSGKFYMSDGKFLLKNDIADIKDLFSDLTGMITDVMTGSNVGGIPVVYPQAGTITAKLIQFESDLNALFQ